ncbi:hypothetical protein M413DRAFT_125354 [Hebeloma cylindrosporum]|uniref:Protein kinase domain-containing protein n=1 Tax=Hebeloma cylindrosporum TaxID=76867 RepID=A0A0C2XZ23_HEBCY|nr:hypothetical protein M413DRAFT_125354 [Hebeloma cylindrosporum h7]
MSKPLPQSPGIVTPVSTPNHAGTTVLQPVNPGAKVGLVDFSSHILPHLSVPNAHTNSVYTRPPHYYDMHLHESLRLKKIVFLDNLPQGFADTFDQSVQGLPAGAHQWKKKPKFDISSIPIIKNESHITRFYRSQLGGVYGSAASGLRFKKSWEDVFIWSTTPAGSVDRNEAIADGFLSINDDPAVLSRLSKEDQESVQLIDQYGLTNFAVWEFKSLVCGPHVMKDIPKLEGSFPWKTCVERLEDDEASSRCKYTNHRIDGRLIVTGRRTGPDASQVSQLINACQFQSGSKRKDRSVSVDDLGGPSNRPRLLDPSGPPQAIIIFPEHARDLIQQGWTEAVIDDATYIIFRAGNEEYIGIRHRGQQTLYLSRCITVSAQKNPTHGKINAALFMLSFDDAANRARQIKCALSPDLKMEIPIWNLIIDKQPELLFLTRPESEDERKARLSDRKTQLEKRDEKDERLADLAMQCKAISLRLHGSLPASSARNRNTWILQRTGNLDPISKNHNGLFIDFERPLSGSERVFCAYLGHTHWGYHSEPLVIKLARTAKQRTELMAEYEQNTKLASRGVKSVVQVYGIFQCTVRSLDEPMFLLMSYGGEALANRGPAYGKKVTTHKLNYRDTYREALCSFRDAKFAHNNITESHVLMDVPKERVTFISIAASIYREDYPKNMDDSWFQQMQNQDHDSVESMLSLEESQNPLEDEPDASTDASTGASCAWDQLLGGEVNGQCVAGSKYLLDIR